MANLFKILKLTLIALLVLLVSGSPKAFASFDNPSIYEQLQWPWYTADSGAAGSCSNTGSGGTPAPAGSAGEALAKQTNLDPKWQALILKYANKFGTDPIAMASILFWENRGYPQYADPFPVNSSDSDSRGRGPWQITSDSWAQSAGSYQTDAYHPDNATNSAAQELKGEGALAGIALGSIDQDFSHGKSIPSMATVMKNYNAGSGSFRQPGIAKYKESGRIWGYNGSGGFINWASREADKPDIIDDYIVAGTYVYYQIATGQPISYKDTASYVQEALTKQDQIKAFKFGGSVGIVGQDSSTGSCVVNSCSPSSQSATGKTVVIDPGHAPAPSGTPREPKTGLQTDDYVNPTEMHRAFEVAQRIGKSLTSAGYSVVYTKTEESPNDFTLDKRAQIANQANPALLFTIHGNYDGQGGGNSDIYSSGDSSWLGYPDSGAYRVPKSGSRADGTNGLTHPEIAGPSKTMAEKLAPLISSKAGLHSSYSARSFSEIYGHDHFGPLGRDPGNTPIQTILSSVTSVYSEVSNVDLNDKFADGVAEAIKSVLGSGTPPGQTQPTPSTPTSTAPTTGTPTPCDGAVAGSAVQTAINYSWPTNLGDTCKQKPSYKTAIDKAVASGQYAGAWCNYPNGSAADKATHGIDCGAFVTRVMIDSGADPGYNYGGDPSKGAGNTTPQQQYLVEQAKAGKYKLVASNPGDTRLLQPGDIAIRDGHTYIFIGSNPPSPFSENSASASESTRAPMARPASDLAFEWYRLIK